jgi:hypothetical protein
VARDRVAGQRRDVRLVPTARLLGGKGIDVVLQPAVHGREEVGYVQDAHRPTPAQRTTR